MNHVIMTSLVELNEDTEMECSTFHYNEDCALLLFVLAHHYRELSDFSNITDKLCICIANFVQ